MNYIETLADVVVLPDYMNCSLLDFAIRLRHFIAEEQKKPNPDNALISVLCDAARLGWELSKTAHR